MTVESANNSMLTCPMMPGEKPGEWQPCPEVMTQAEAIRYLRLDEVNIKDPAATLRHYREMGLLRATRVSRSIRYLRSELQRFLEQQTQRDDLQLT